MPHVSVKMFPGRSEADKKRFTEEVVRAITGCFGGNVDSVSVDIEEVPSGDWMTKVYDPQIRPNMQRLYKRPGYKPF